MFMRVPIPYWHRMPSWTRILQLARLGRGFSRVAEAFHMSRQLHDKAARVGTPIMVSRLGCPASKPTDQVSL
jgi:hypothetical protein